MSCHGKTGFAANDASMTWEEFRDATIGQGRVRGDEGFIAYLQGVTQNAWTHVLSENFLTPKNAEAKLWSFYCSDVKGK